MCDRCTSNKWCSLRRLSRSKTPKFSVGQGRQVGVGFSMGHLNLESIGTSDDGPPQTSRERWAYWHAKNSLAIEIFLQKYLNEVRNNLSRYRSNKSFKFSMKLSKSDGHVVKKVAENS